MRIWQRNHGGGNICSRVIEITDTAYHAEVTGGDERLATLDDRLRHSLDLAEARADEMVRHHFDHECRSHLCDRWHLVPTRAHGESFPLMKADPEHGPPEHILIVRRSRTAWADYLAGRLGNVGERVESLWDRRYGERRRGAVEVESDRRGNDRRGRAPRVWNRLNFILVYSLDVQR